MGSQVAMASPDSQRPKDTNSGSSTAIGCGDRRRATGLEVGVKRSDPRADQYRPKYGTLATGEPGRNTMEREPSDIPRTFAYSKQLGSPADDHRGRPYFGGLACVSHHLGGDFRWCKPLILPDFDAVAIASEHELRIYSLQTSERLLVMPTPPTLEEGNGHKDRITCIRRDRRHSGRILTSSDDGTVKSWDLTTGVYVETLVTVQGKIESFLAPETDEEDLQYVVSPRDVDTRKAHGSCPLRNVVGFGKMALHCAGSSRIWMHQDLLLYLGTPEELNILVSGATKPVKLRFPCDIGAVAVSPSGEFLAIGSYGMVQIFSTGQLRDEKIDAFTKLHWHSTAVCGLAFTCDDEILSVAEEGVMVIWDIKARVPAFVTGLDGKVSHMTACPEKSLVALTFCTNSVSIYDTNTRNLVTYVAGIDFCPTLRRVASRRKTDGVLALPDQQALVRLYDPEHQTVLQIIECIPTRRLCGDGRASVLQTAFSNDGNWLLTVGHMDQDDFFSSRTLLSFWERADPSMDLRTTISLEEAPVCCIPAMDSAFLEVGRWKSRVWAYDDGWSNISTIHHDTRSSKATCAVVSVQSPLYCIGFEDGFTLFQEDGTVIREYWNQEGVKALHIFELEARLRVITSRNILYLDLRTLKVCETMQMDKIVDWDEEVLFNSPDEIIFDVPGNRQSFRTVPQEARRVFKAPKGLAARLPSLGQAKSNGPSAYIFEPQAVYGVTTPDPDARGPVPTNSDAVPAEAVARNRVIYPQPRQDFTSLFGSGPGEASSLMPELDLEVRRSYLDFKRWENLPADAIPSVFAILEDSLRFGIRLKQ